MNFDKEKRKSKPKNDQQTQHMVFFLLVLVAGIGAGFFTFRQSSEFIESPTIPLPDGNILSNGSFEENPFTEDSIWTIDERGTDLEVIWSEDHTYTGNYAVQLSASEGNNSGWPGLFTTVSADGFEYVFSANVFSPDGASGWLSVDLLDGEGKLIRGYSTGCTESKSDWHTKSYTLEASYYQDFPVSAIRLGLLQCLNFSEGEKTTLYFDDVSLVAQLPQQ